MIKIMLVEDDKSLREIYGVRLLAEGYDIVSAGDGEQALAVAIKERPALIVTDVMMPKISGFDMLDILRSTTETKNIKVIVMTALGSDEQRIRGESLGADRYLVKSQVGIEDVVRTVHEVLDDKPIAPVTPPRPAPATARTATPPPAMPAPTPTLPQAPNQPSAQRIMVTPPTLQSTATPAQPPAATTPATTTPTPRQPMPTPTIKNRIIQPLTDPTASKVDINELLDRELAKEAGIDLANRPAIASTQEEKAMVQDKLDQFSGTPPPPPSVAPEPPTIQIDSDGRVSMPPTTPPAPVTPPAQSPAPAPTPGTPPPPPPPVR